MNYLALIVVAIVGITLGMYIARRNANSGFIAKQMEQKTENKQKVIELRNEGDEILSSAERMWRY